MPKNLFQRNGIYWARFKVAGQEYRESLRTRVERQAEKLVAKRIEEVTAGVFFGEKGPTSWQAAVVSWHQHATTDLGDKTLLRYKTSLKQLRPFLDGKNMHQIDLDVVKEVVKARRRSHATTATIRRDLTAMSSVIEHAIDEGWMLNNHTLAVRRKLKEKRDPIVLPQEGSMAMMLAASPKRFADAQEFARETGMRQEEIFGLTWPQVNAKAATITMVGKGNKLRVIPLSRKAKQITTRQPQFLGAPWVFYHGEGERWTSPGSRFTDVRRRVARKAAQDGTAFEPFRFHDLRHLFAVEYLQAKRGSLYDLKELLGHASIKTTEEYLDFLTPEQKKAAMHGVSQKKARG